VTTVTPTHSSELDVRTAERRQRVGVFNRRLGWTILPLVLLAVSLHYLPLPGDEDLRNHLVWAIQWVFVPLVFVHLVLSWYVFGPVRPARTLRVFHVWFGYAYILFILASQTTHGRGTLHAVFTVAMFACLAVHVGIGVYYARRRRGVTTGRGALVD
jgi:hypothetical protein